MPKLDSWRHGAAVRRDARQAPTPSETPKPRGSRDTKRWCRGKPGVPHKLVVASRATLKNDLLTVRSFDAKWLIRYCTSCGKEVAWYYPMGSFSGEPPDWVVEFRAAQATKVAP